MAGSYGRGFGSDMKKFGTLSPAKAIAGGAVLFAVAACAGQDGPAYVERSVEELYNDAVDALDDGQSAGAATLFEEVERQHPYSIWATKAQLMGAYAYYETQEYDDAVLSLDRFIQLHPGNRDVAYAYYLRALSYYEQISDVGRDQRITEQALAGLEEVVRRFPDSKYARDARLKVDLTRDHLAGKEMQIGRFYLQRGHYLAAINRFRTVIDDYQTTTHTPEALHRLTEAYSALGIAPEARESAAVLGYNYPGTDWYGDSYQVVEGAPADYEEEDGGFLARLWPF